MPNPIRVALVRLCECEGNVQVRLLPMGLLGAPLEHLFRIRGRNGAVSIFDYDGQAATVECINDTSHLADLAAKDLSDYGARPA